MAPDTWAEKFESFERINSIRETNGCSQPFTWVAWVKISVCFTYRIYPFETFEFLCSWIRGRWSPGRQRQLRTNHIQSGIDCGNKSSIFYVGMYSVYIHCTYILFLMRSHQDQLSCLTTANAAIHFLLVEGSVRTDTLGLAYVKSLHTFIGSGAAVRRADMLASCYFSRLL